MRKRAAAGVLAVAALAGAILLVTGTLRKTAKGALSWWVEHQRKKSRAVSPPFGHLAASQVGYGPGMEKLFTSPERFTSFRVIREGDGSVAFDGGGPVREVPTALPGARGGAAFIGDFSPLRVEGRYRIVGAGTSSHPFDVREDVFDPPLRAAQRGFYFQRAFTSIDAAYAEGPWVHPGDAASAPPGVRQGWHDAGDFSIYSASLNSALFWLLEAFSDFAPARDDTNIPESGNGIPDLLDEARWGLGWLLSVQDATGGFRNSTCEERYGPYGTNSPERAAPYRNGEVGTLATARAVGNLAYAATLYRRFDPEFAARCLEAARRGYGYLLEHPDEATDGPTCPAYRQDGDAKVGREVRAFSAAGMLLASGERRFREDFDRFFSSEDDRDPSYLHFNGLAAQLYLRAPRSDPKRKAAIEAGLRKRAAQAREQGERHPFQFAGPTHWGSLAAGLTRTNSTAVRACLEDPAAAAADCAQAMANVHYMLGRNYLQFCYLSGVAGVTSGRTRAFHHWLATLRAQPFLFPGMLAGGPNDSPDPADSSNPLARPIPVWGYWGDPAFPRDRNTPIEQRYTDNDSWSTNEVSLDWQAPAVYALHFARWLAHRPSSRQ